MGFLLFSPVACTHCLVRLVGVSTYIYTVSGRENGSALALYIESPADWNSGKRAGY